MGGHAQGQVPGDPPRAGVPHPAGPYREELHVGAPRGGEEHGDQPHRLARDAPRRVRLRGRLCQPVLHLLPGGQDLQGPDRGLRWEEGDDRRRGREVAQPLPLVRPGRVRRTLCARGFSSVYLSGCAQPDPRADTRGDVYRRRSVQTEIWPTPALGVRASRTATAILSIRCTCALGYFSSARARERERERELSWMNE